MQTSPKTNQPAGNSSTPARPEAKPPLSVRAPMTAHEASLYSVFDACIPGNMLMYPTCPRDAGASTAKT